MYASKSGIISLLGARWNLFHTSEDLTDYGVTLKKILRLVAGPEGVI